MFYVENNVFDEALNRIRMLYDTHEDIIVCMSGGKDSTVLFNMTLMIAREKGRLPVKVFWLDQEAEWQHTVDYMNSVMHLPEVEPYWYQIPFDFPNNLSPQNKTLKVWDDADKVGVIMEYSEIGADKSKVLTTLQRMVREAFDARGWKLKDISYAVSSAVVEKDGEDTVTFACVAEWWE